MPQLVKNATVREEILQGMIASFQLEGIKISQETAYTILERVDLKLKMCKGSDCASCVILNVTLCCYSWYRRTVMISVRSMRFY